MSGTSPTFLPGSPFFASSKLVIEIWLARSVPLHCRFCAPSAVGCYSTTRPRTVQRFGCSNPLTDPRNNMVLSRSSDACVPGRDRSIYIVLCGYRQKHTLRKMSNAYSL